MLIEYDLVIIGATELGCHMALRAKELGARVALVEQGERPDGSIAFRQWILNQSQRVAVTDAGGPQTPNSGGFESTEFRLPQNWGLGGGLAAIVLDDKLAPFTPEALQLQGIDYIKSSGTWIKTPKSGFQVDERLLRSTSFVSALTPKRRIPVALWKIPCLFPEAFPLEGANPLPSRVAIIGEAIVGVELAMALKGLGVAVTLLVPTPQILPQMSPEGAFRIQVMLEAAGIQVLTGTRLRSAENLHNQIQLQLTDEVLEVDQVILATAFERLDPERLGLRSFNGPALRKHRLHLVGSAGRRSGFDAFDGLTSNPESIALAEVQRLLMPWKRQRSIPVGQLRNPPSLWIGSFSASPSRPKRDQHLPRLTGRLNDRNLWYHLTLTRNGELVNATVVGEDAPQFGALLSLMLQTRMPIDQLSTIALSSPIQTQVIHQWVSEWEIWSRSRHRLRHELFLDGLAFRRRRSD
jgi:Pyridine nucleotide-disulphide oxidoreductase